MESTTFAETLGVKRAAATVERIDPRELVADAGQPMNRQSDQAEFIAGLDQVLADLRDLLIRKNAAYGNSALDPIRLFSKSDPVEQIKVRIDDKLSRLARGHEFLTENTEQDLLGYLVILAIARKVAP